MNNDIFKQKMAELEKELDDHIARLTPEGQQEFKQKQNDFIQQEDVSNIRFAFTSDSGNAAKNTQN